MVKIKLEEIELNEWSQEVKIKWTAEDKRFVVYIPYKRAKVIHPL